jgi:sugar phosphate isomerase/epimerase
MNDRLHVHVPYPVLEESLEFLAERRLNAEVFFSAESLENLVPERLGAAAEFLSTSGLATTIHAPFMDLNPGSFEPLLMEATRRRFRQVMGAVRLLRPRVVVFHPGYDRWRYGETTARWLETSLETWRETAAEAESIGTVVAVENIFDEEPEVLRALLDGIGSPCVGHCFDVGHWNLFGKVSMEEWFRDLGSRIVEAHIHDNAGEKDDHAAIGAGTVDFPLFFSLMELHAPDAVWTIEAHSRKTLEEALVKIRPFLECRSRREGPR